MRQIIEVFLFQTKYHSEIERVDFENDGRDIESSVNAWVSEKTNSMIEELLPNNTLEPDDVMIILAAIYFKGLCNRQCHCHHWRMNLNLIRE